MKFVFSYLIIFIHIHMYSGKLLSLQGNQSEIFFFEERAQWIDLLGSVSYQCLSSSQQDALFEGCVDWHSTCGSYYAVFKMGNQGTGIHQNLVFEIHKRFTREKIRNIERDLIRIPDKEMPYGRSWLLVTTKEHDRWIKTHINDQQQSLLFPLADLAASSLDIYIKNVTEEDFLHSNNYQSLTFASIQLLDYYQYEQKIDNYENLVQHLKSKLPATINYHSKMEKINFNFFSTFWNQIDLYSRLFTVEELILLIDFNQLKSKQFNPSLIPGPSGQARIHNLGLIWNYTWVLKSLISKLSTSSIEESDLKKMQSLYHQTRRKGLMQFMQFNGDLHSYDHWVPFFALYSL